MSTRGTSVVKDSIKARLIRGAARAAHVNLRQPLFTTHHSQYSLLTFED